MITFDINVKNQFVRSTFHLSIHKKEREFKKKKLLSKQFVICELLLNIMCV